MWLKQKFAFTVHDDGEMRTVYNINRKGSKGQNPHEPNCKHKNNKCLFERWITTRAPHRELFAEFLLHKNRSHGDPFDTKDRR